MVPAPPDAFVAMHYDIEPDASAASYFFAAAAIAGGAACLFRLAEEETPSLRLLQGDGRFVDVLEQMGCRVKRADKSAIRHLQGLDRDTWQVTLAMTAGRPSAASTST